MGKLFRKPSLKRALGISAAKGKLSRQIGIPLTKSGRKKKLKRATGCLFPFLIGLSLLLGGFVATAEPITLKAKIVGVTDGDTITALDKNNTEAKLRLHGIDTPESGQAFGTKAKELTSELCFGKMVDIKIVDTDRYGRFVAVVTLPDGKTLNDELVKAGMAWWYEQYAPKDAILRDLQRDAKAEKRGLWADSDPVPPWDFRKVPAAPEGQVGTIPKTSTPAPSVQKEAPQVQTQTGEVFVTRTGEKYHRGSCRYLSKSKIPIDLADAKARYGACSVCKP